MSTLNEKVTQWIAHDPDPATQKELQALLDAGDHEALAERFQGPLSFGTAGLRGAVAAGESRMNVATVSRATYGVGKYLVDLIDSPKVVVGCDARHGSADFYQATCEILSALGIEVLALPQQLPTPITAFSVRYFDCDAGIMVTASHNPPQDNGYKVYLGGRVVHGEAEQGVQLISPADAEISAQIDAAPFADEIARNRERIRDIAAEEVLEPYFARALELPQAPATTCDIPMVFTAMHGVGGATLGEALKRAGFSHAFPCPEQQEPDPDFPTVAFPNPEEAGALDLSYQEADRRGAELILALDPDADRCSVAIKHKGTWRQLSGDEVGALLGEDIARAHHGDDDATLACSIVSSQLLGEIARGHGLKFANTLTGFKWIGRTPNLIFGYEEALGYCSDPQAVRDKDGITACLRVADLNKRLVAEGKNIQDLLDEIAQAYGLYKTSPLTFRVADTSLIQQGLHNLETTAPKTLGGAEVTEFSNLSDGFRGLPGTPGFWIATSAKDRIVVRPSGTEPKLKCYLEVVSDSHKNADERLDALKIELKEILGF
ncbi:phospho-sugar mutase [Corynebacterium sp. ES2794-CONJ1]|uniref:phospho-sugar mutase n=1 Tax=unclassified Corynebacterium TaxID=2624378 RepID=UPI00216A5118|nr:MULTISPECIES: phospho-sugar mutase [unclassified Corynebacterium]MCS4491933.1 phospho-sugar mutase [Corynebacterium sp. ES2715-CONJ3]MCS4532038.1 phospho-sugar mutase [Corynebacterium sp. ES2730-CONJ]MCU9519439.1 phospho-sugar mutase [Corynebacterium sp. ES2794-CONJ1]